jgi:pilus assembly protein CpaF
MVDARLPDGSRVNAIIPPCAVDGASITIRKFRKERLTIKQLIESDSLTQAMADFLRACVLGRLNIIISGGTGSGKTTFLNVLSGFIPEGERIVTIEDSAELKLQQIHVVRLETKLASVEGQGAVGVRELVRNSLRMRPDRIIVGECRGGEALDMLQAMNTGHDGLLTTVHANSPRDALSRLETLVLMAGMDLPLKIVRQQISSAVDLIVQMSRLRDGDRKITAIVEVAGMEGDVIVLSDIFKFNKTGVDTSGKILGQHKATGIRPLFGPRLEAAGFKLGAKIFGATAADMAMAHQRR